MRGDGMWCDDKILDERARWINRSGGGERMRE